MPDAAALAARMGVGAPVVDALWQRALTHRSVENAPMGHYERLEFLGDRVLALALAAWLAEVFPDEPEGLLALRLATLAREETLVQIAHGWELAPHVVLGNAMRGGEGVKPSILADCVEALLAVVWREQGFATVEAVVRRSWLPFLDAAAGKDPKTALQEVLQAKKGACLPVYEVVREEGPEHDKLFYVKVVAAGREAEGCGASKKEAEAAAARAWMEKGQSHG